MLLAVSRPLAMLLRMIRLSSPNVSAELREDDGNATAVEILVILGCREEEEEAEEDDGSDCNTIG